MFLLKRFSFVFWISLLFQFSAISMDPPKIHHKDLATSSINIDVGNVELFDPPFYLIETEDNKLIYILGGIHPLPVTKALSETAFNELDRIAKTKPMFITEHSASNEVNLSMLNKATTLKDWINNGIIIDTHRHLFAEIQNEYITVDTETKSEILQLKQLKNYDPWIVLPIITIHIGSILKKKFSSFEHSILHIWGNDLSPEHYLEEHADTLLAEEKSAAHKYHYNIGGIDYFLSQLKIAMNYETDHESQEHFKLQFLNHIENFKWENLHKREEEDAPTIERNHIWVKTFLEKYYQQKQTFLIVVGLGHLEGPNNFLFLLLSRLKIKGNIKRFSNEHGWENIT